MDKLLQAKLIQLHRRYFLKNVKHVGIIGDFRHVRFPAVSGICDAGVLTV
jgi:hypothetical protein